MVSRHVAALDRSLARSGQAVSLRRYTGPSSSPLSTWVDLPMQAKAIPAKTTELVAGINMTGRRLILSPTPLNAAGGWPVPVRGRDAIMDGSVRRVIEVWSPILAGDQVVRIEAQVA